jgi:transposase
MAPALLAQPGIGPISAAQLLISWSHPGRFRSEAAFAMLAGVAPVQASSGQVVRHRLNRGGDRQLNRALHTIVMLRQVHHGPTRAYTSRRIAQGKSQREIRRCLKRTLARQLYRLLERAGTGRPSRAAPTSRGQVGRGRFVLGAAGGPVDLDRYPAWGRP